jgi:tight adherence protein B
MSLILLSVGASAATLMGNMFLVPVMSLGCSLLPFWYIRLTQSGYKKDLAAELETALSVITSAYLRTEDIHTAIEESLQYVNPPAYQVFKNLLLRIELIDPDMDAAILELRTKIDNEVFREWCDGLIACQYDRSLKTTLTPIVNKLSDMRIVNGELENLVFEPRKEFITMVLLVVGNIPLIYCLNKSWFDTLMHSVVGQFVLALCAVAIFVSAAFVMRLTQPIEYRR